MNTKILIWSFTMLLGCTIQLNAQVTDSTQTEPPPVGSDSFDLTAPETVTLADTSYILPETVKGTSHSQATEVIRVYSGSHDGNNIIKTVEISLPEGRPSEQSGYVPR